MKIIITGGCGFIGINLIKNLLKNRKYQILNIDNLEKSSMPEWLKEYKEKKRYSFVKLDISNQEKVKKTLINFSPDLIFHLAAESHVDNSIKNPKKFVKTNILGTFNLLEASRLLLKKIPKKINRFRFIHISTDEVYGSLSYSQSSSNEKKQYEPNSPYSASKASSDHLVRAWNRTFGVPVITTHCCNNYGPYQYPEKLIPVIISKTLNNKNIPIYGNGKNIREWLYVEDHVQALLTIAKRGKIGETYNIGSKKEISNIELTKLICKILDKLIPNNKPHSKLIKFVKDRKGHDIRYSLNSKKLENELNYKTKIKFKEGLIKTIKWYVNNKDWLLKKNKI